LTNTQSPFHFQYRSPARLETGRRGAREGRRQGYPPVAKTLPGSRYGLA
jgi:hypothetical protein